MKNLIKTIKNSKRVAIFAHTSPDSDCMGSLTALSLILNALNKQTKCFVDSNSFKTELVNVFNLTNALNEDVNAEEFDTFISVDVPSFGMLGKYGEVFKNFKNTISIDHHSSRDLTAKCVYVDSSKASCSEIIYDLALALKVKITSSIASALYAGIIGDTNCFQNDNTNAKCLFVASKLMQCGANAKDIVFWLTKYNTSEGLNLKKLVYENMVIKNQIAYAIITTKMQKEAGTDEGGNIVNELLNLDNNKFAFVVKQKEKNTYSVSLRCKAGYNVSRIAEKFGGGGHKQASGAGFVGAPVKNAKLIYEECYKQIQKDN